MKTVRSLSRGLQVLRALNASNFSNAAQISQAVGLPRPTVYRLLQTLAAEGYVAHFADEDVFSVRGQALELSRALDAPGLAADLSRPLVDALSDEIVWPIDVLTFDGQGMRVCHSTHGRSPRSLLPRSAIGASLSLLRTSPGRIFLATLPEDERRSLMADAIRREDPDASGQSATDLQAMILRTQELGYGFRDGGLLPKTTSIAVSVCCEGRPVACISAMFMRSAVPLPLAVERYLEPMRAVAGRIEAQLAAA